MVFPWISYLEVLQQLLGYHQEMGDIEYLSKKEFDGKLVRDEGTATATAGDLAKLTAGTGKELYLGIAKVSASLTAQAATDRVFTVELQINGTVIETWTGFLRFDTADGGANSMDNYEFATKGIKVSATDEIIIDVTSAATNVTINAVLEGFEENTGTDPTILASQITVDADVSGAINDIAFIQGKVEDGDYFQVSGDINALNDTIEYIVPDGRTAYLLESKIIITTHSDMVSLGAAGGADVKVTDERVAADLKIDGVTKDRTNIGMVQASTRGGGGVALQDSFGGGGGSAGNIGDGKFNVVGISLAGNGIKKIEIENTLDDGSAFATMSGYLV